MAHESKQFSCACEGSLIRPHLCFAIISIIIYGCVQDHSHIRPNGNNGMEVLLPYKATILIQDDNCAQRTCQLSCHRIISQRAPLGFFISKRFTSFIRYCVLCSTCHVSDTQSNSIVMWILVAALCSKHGHSN